MEIVRPYSLDTFEHKKTMEKIKGQEAPKGMVEVYRRRHGKRLYQTFVLEDSVQSNTKTQEKTQRKEE
jgi:hypothetical protein